MPKVDYRALSMPLRLVTAEFQAPGFQSVINTSREPTMSRHEGPKSLRPVVELNPLYTPTLLTFLGAVFGVCLGAPLGLFAAPPWEMAFVVTGPLGAVTGMVAGALSDAFS